ncbi:MAG: diacylglycerol/lipid kinase family protein [Acidimicrobiia bacterium]
MRWLFVVNAKAGRRPVDLNELRRIIADRHIDAVIAETASVHEIRSAVEQAEREGVDGYVAVGGDGSAHHLLNALMALNPDSPVVFGVIASGSGSDFVRTFGHTTDISSSIDRLVACDLYRVDIGHVTHGEGSAFFLNALNAGVAAASVQVAERMPRQLGSVRYTTAFWGALARFRQAVVEVAIDHHRFSDEAINVVVANGQFFGGGLNIAPKATLVDGLFDVQIFSGPKRNAFTVMPRLVFGSHMTHRAVRRYVGSSLQINVPEDWPLEADGEVLGSGSATVTMHAGAVDFVI